MNDSKKTEKTNPITAIILAAGKGTRMMTPLPKVLHPVCGKPMIVKVIEACQSAGVHEIRVVVGHGGQLVKSIVEPFGVKIFNQAQQLGTGDAVRSAMPETISGDILVLNGDHPLIESNDILTVIKEYREQKLDLAVITCKLKKPGAFGRIIRHQGQLKAIVEAKDASADTLKICEVNTGIYFGSAALFQELLPRIQNKNAKGEYYITDLISLAVEDGWKVAPLISSPKVAFGVNTQEELSKANRLLFLRKAKALLEQGVLIVDPKNTYIEDDVEVLSGAILYPQVYLRGKTKVSSFSSIEPGCYIVDSVLQESVQIKAYSYLEKVLVKTKASIGPFARLRPETEIGEEAHVGNFVEMKKVKFGAKAKSGHLTYLGDAEVGEGTNIGCGTITCNYAVDKKKYKTLIGKNVFVGSDSQFIAPVTVGDHAVIGSGSTITKDVPAKALAVARSKQFVKENYVHIDENKNTSEDQS